MARRDLTVAPGLAAAAGDLPAPLRDFSYPMHLDVEAIQGFIPHRGDMLFARQITVHAHDHYTGEAAWPADSFVFRGHFPGQPIVPGVMLVEAAAQMAGAGLRAGDRRARAASVGMVGLLLAVRKCFFRSPVSPGLVVHFDLQTRQVSDEMVNVTGEVTSQHGRVASLEFVIAQAPVEQVMSYL